MLRQTNFFISLKERTSRDEIKKNIFAGEEKGGGRFRDQLRYGQMSAVIPNLKHNKRQNVTNLSTSCSSPGRRNNKVFYTSEA
jgi:hypothetical protein